jgi:hypothetical protein
MATQFATLEIAFDRKGTYQHINVAFKRYSYDSDSQKYTLDWRSYDIDDCPFQGVRLTNQTDREHLARDENANTLDAFYCIRPEWNFYRSDLAEVEAAAKALRKIKKSTDKAAEVGGEPKSFGQLVLRLAKAIGVSQLWIERSWATNPLMQLDSGANLIDRVITAMMAAARNGASLAEVPVE